MDGLTLLTEAWAAGLSVHADGARLVIRGPKSADAVARRLLAHKAVVLPALTGGNGNTTPPNPEKNGGSVDVDGPCPWDEATDPGPPCRVCGSVEHWQDAMGGGHCQRCEVETLDKALKLTERAARLRTQAQQRPPAHQDCACCVGRGRVDILDLEGTRPVQAMLGGFGGA